MMSIYNEQNLMTKPKQSTMADKKRKGHGIMISLPFQGHITPFVNLALNLASNGITITFVHLQSVHHRLCQASNHSNTSHDQTDFFADARESGLDIRYTTISDGFPQEFDRDLHVGEYWISLFHNFPAIADDFVGKMIRSDPNSAHFLVTDAVYGWSTAIAEKYNLVNVLFWTQPALVFTLPYHWDLMVEKGHVPFQDNEDVVIDYIPGVQSISTKDMMRSFKQLETITSKIMFTAINAAKKADFILHNTVHELESTTLSALNKYQPNYAIGPVNFSQFDSTKAFKSLRPGLDCSQWLDSKHPGSVLYVSFGSVARTSKEAIEEIAYGLLLSEVNFVWVVRDCMTISNDGNVLPSGFEDEIKDRGLIVSWCDQIMVLSNPRVGGFLTHCGWNSVVESMWFGVPMICYPLAYDQPTNRKLLVDDWKIGVNLCDGPSIDRKEVAEKIKSFMNGSISEKLKEEDKKFGKILHNALGVDGSSKRNFDQFMKDLENFFC